MLSSKASPKVPPSTPNVHRSSTNRNAKALTLTLAAASLLSVLFYTHRFPGFPSPKVPHYAEDVLKQCAHLKTPAGAPPDFAPGRTESDRFVKGTRPVLIANASLWTGGDNGNEVVHGDILLDRGIIKAVGTIPKSVLGTYRNIDHVNAEHAWVTPGIVDIHSHIGVDSIPFTRGASL